MPRARARVQPRAGPDAEPAARRAGRLLVRRPGRRDGRVEPSPGPRSGSAPPRPLRPAGARARARPRGPRGDPRRPHEAASRSPPTSTCRSSRARRPASPAPTSRTSPTRQRSPPAAAGRTRSRPRTSTPPWSASSPVSSSAASSRRRRSASSPTTRPATRSCHISWASALPVHKVTIVSRGQALGYTLNLPAEDRYLHTKEELTDMMKVYPRRPGGRAGCVRPRDERRRERPRAGDRPRPRDGLRLRHVGDRLLADDARRQLLAVRGDEAAARRRAGAAHRRGLRRGDAAADEVPRCRSTAIAQALLERETLVRNQLDELLDGVPQGVAELRDGRHRPRSAASATESASTSIRAWRRGASTTSVVAVDDLDEAVPRTSGCSARRSRLARRCRRRAPRPPRCSSATAGSSCSRRLDDDTPVGRFLARRGPGMHHVAYEVDDIAAELARLDAKASSSSTASRARPVRSPGGVPPSRRSIHGVLSELVTQWLTPTCPHPHRLPGRRRRLDARSRGRTRTRSSTALRARDGRRSASSTARTACFSSCSARRCCT